MKLTYAIVKVIVCESMTDAVNAYRNNPSADHYLALQHAMMVYQQLGQIKIDQREKLADELSRSGVGAWDDMIVMTAQGMTLKQALKK